MKSTVHTEFIKGIPISIPNKVTTECKDFYVSYNTYDRRIYGCDTTALVYGNMKKFYILNGNHTAEYDKLKKDGFDACFKYFLANKDKISKYSDV